MGLEGRKLVDHHHVVVKGQPALLNQPLHVFPVDDMQADSLPQCRLALGFRAHRHGVGQAMQVIPFHDLRRPCVPCYPQWRYNQCFADFKAIQTQVKQRC